VRLPLFYKTLAHSPLAFFWLSDSNHKAALNRIKSVGQQKQIKPILE